MLEPDTLTVSSFCDLPDAGCVGAVREGEHVLVHDSKDELGAALRFTLGEWEVFLAGVRNGEFDLTE